MRSDYLTSGAIAAIAIAIFASRFQAIPALAILYLLIVSGFGVWKLARYWRSR